MICSERVYVVLNNVGVERLSIKWRKKLKRKVYQENFEQTAFL